MSKLEFYARPLVAFDPSNKQHRRHYYEFLRSRTWGGALYGLSVLTKLGQIS